MNVDRRRACWGEAQRSRKLSNLINTIILNGFYLSDFYFFLTLLFLSSFPLSVYVFYMNTLIASQLSEIWGLVLVAELAAPIYTKCLINNVFIAEAQPPEVVANTQMEWMPFSYTHSAAAQLSRAQHCCTHRPIKTSLFNFKSIITLQRLSFCSYWHLSCK